MSPAWHSSRPFASKAARSLIAGTVIGAISVTFAVSLAAIIFTGAYSNQLYTGVSIALLSATVLGVVLALRSSFPGTIGGPQDKAASILAVMAVSISATLPDSAGSTLFPTLFVCMALSTGATALVLYLLGVFGLGNTARFMPYAVVGGFLAGTGWLLIKGAFAMMTGAPLEPWNLSWLLSPDALPLWVPGIVFALLLTVFGRRRPNPLLTPAIVVAGVAVVYAWIGVSGMSLETARAARVILPSFQGEMSVPLVTIGILRDADWDVVLAQLPLVGAVVVVSAFSLLFYSSGLEVATKRDIDINRELKATGIANALCLPAGGIAGFNIFSDTLLGARMGAADRATGLVAAGICAATLFGGASLVSFFPVAVLGGLILHLGFGFIVEWLYDVRRTLPRHEYLLLVLIFGIVVAVGFLVAVVVGIIAAAVLFAATYSRVDVVRYSVSGADVHSSVARSDAELDYLRDHGGRALVLKLQGFIFFGTAYRLTSYVRELSYNVSERAPRFLVLDFEAVTGFDYSTLVSLVRVRQLAEGGGVLLVFSGLDTASRDRMILHGLAPGASEGAVLFEEDLDHAMERIENRILDDMEREETGDRPAALSDWLAREPGDGPAARELVGHMERVVFNDGQELIRQGDNDSDLYFVETGRVLTRLVAPNGRATRLHASGPGTVVGDMAFHLGGPRTASVVAQGRCVAYRLSVEKITAIEAKQPGLALYLHKLLSRRLSRHLADANRLLRQVMY